MTTNRVNVNFSRGAGVEADGDEPGDGDERAGQHGKGGGRVDRRGRLGQGIPGLEARHHHLHRNHGVVDEQAEGDGGGPSEMRCSQMPRNCMTMKVMARTSGIARFTTRAPAPQPEADEAHRQHDQHRLDQGVDEAGDGLHHRLQANRRPGERRRRRRDRPRRDPCFVSAPRRTPAGSRWGARRWRARWRAGR